MLEESCGLTSMRIGMVATGGIQKSERRKQGWRGTFVVRSLIMCFNSMELFFTKWLAQLHEATAVHMH